MFLTTGRAYDIPTVALRYFNIYGSRQSLSNPYTGVVAIFSSRLMNHKAPIIFEDGLQSRDFVNVKDIVQANLLALEKEEADFETFNVGTGIPTSICTAGEVLREKLAPECELLVLGQYRIGDIRHCYADIRKITTRLNYAPTVSLSEGMDELLRWVSTQQADDMVETAKTQLLERNLVK